MNSAPESDPEPVRVGVVSYLNAVPLVRTLGGQPGVAVVGAPPSRIADWLREDRIDVGLVPVVEFIRQPDLVLVSDACVGARGPVDSVLLLCREDPESVRTCTLDSNSRTSQILAQVVLRDHYGAQVRFDEASADAAWASGRSDAVLVIGDQALRMRPSIEARVVDLSAAWLEMTGLPFVFAVWAARPGVAQRNPGLATTLEFARDRGCAMVDEIARDCADWGNLSPAQARVYLAERIRYRLAAEDRAGLERFLELARPLVEGTGSEERCSTSG